MSGKATDYAGKDIPICSYRDSCIYPLFAEPAMFRPCRNSLAPLMLSHSGGFFEDFDKIGFSYINIYTPIYLYAKND